MAGILCDLFRPVNGWLVDSPIRCDNLTGGDVACDGKTHCSSEKVVAGKMPEARYCRFAIRTANFSPKPTAICKRR